MMHECDGQTDGRRDFNDSKCCASLRCAAKKQKKHFVDNECRLGTGNTAISHFEELLITTRVTEECRVDNDRAFPASCACAVQQEMDVNVAVASEWYFTQCRDQRVISTITCCFEYDNITV